MHTDHTHDAAKKHFGEKASISRKKNNLDELNNAYNTEIIDNVTSEIITDVCVKIFQEVTRRSCMM